MISERESLTNTLSTIIFFIDQALKHQTKHKLLIFSELRVMMTQEKQLEKDKIIVTKCLHRHLKLHQQNRQPLQNLSDESK